MRARGCEHRARPNGVTISDQVVAGVERRVHLELAIRRLPCTGLRHRVGFARSSDLTDIAKHPRTHIDDSCLVTGQATPASFDGRTFDHIERLTGPSAGRKRVSVGDVSVHRRVNRGDSVDCGVRARLDGAQRESDLPHVHLEKSVHRCGRAEPVLPARGHRARQELVRPRHITDGVQRACADHLSLHTLDGTTRLLYERVAKCRRAFEVLAVVGDGARDLECPRTRVARDGMLGVDTRRVELGETQQHRCPLNAGVGCVIRVDGFCGEIERCRVVEPIRGDAARGDQRSGRDSLGTAQPGVVGDQQRIRARHSRQQPCCLAVQQSAPRRGGGRIEHLAHDGVPETVRAVARFEQSKAHTDIEVFEQSDRIRSQYGREHVNVHRRAEHRRAHQRSRRVACFRATVEHRRLDRLGWGGSRAARRELREKERIAAAALVEMGGVLVTDDLACRVECKRRQFETQRGFRHCAFIRPPREQHEHRQVRTRDQLGDPGPRERIRSLDVIDEHHTRRRARSPYDTPQCREEHRKPRRRRRVRLRNVGDRVDLR